MFRRAGGGQGYEKLRIMLKTLRNRSTETEKNWENVKWESTDTEKFHLENWENEKWHSKYCELWKMWISKNFGASRQAD